MGFREPRRLSVLYEILVDVKKQLFSVALAQIITSRRQVGLRFGFGSRNFNLVKTIYSEGAEG